MIAGFVVIVGAVWSTLAVSSKVVESVERDDVVDAVGRGQRELRERDRRTTVDGHADGRRIDVADQDRVGGGGVPVVVADRAVEDDAELRTLTVRLVEHSLVGGRADVAGVVDRLSDVVRVGDTGDRTDPLVRSLDLREIERQVVVAAAVQDDDTRHTRLVIGRLDLEGRARRARGRTRREEARRDDVGSTFAGA